jgi:class 3 adenylate cyclase
MSRSVRSSGRKISVGLNYGPIASVAFEASGYREAMLVGSVVDVAAFIQKAARSGEVLASSTVVEKLSGELRATRAPAVALKGIQRRVQVFRIEGRRREAR